MLLSVCLYVRVVCHTRAPCYSRWTERNEMLFGSDTRVVPSNIILERDPGLQLEGEIWGSEPPLRTMPPIAQITLAFVFEIVFSKYSNFTMEGAAAMTEQLREPCFNLGEWRHAHCLIL